MRRGEHRDAAVHLATALAIHTEHGHLADQAMDLSWLVERARRVGDLTELEKHTATLGTLLPRLAASPRGQLLYFRLYRGLEHLGSEASATLDALRRALHELMRKTGYLSAERRHAFLYNIREHQELLDAAMAHDLSWPEQE